MRRKNSDNSKLIQNISAPQISQGHQNQVNSDKLSKPREAQEDRNIKCNVVFWMVSVTE